MDAVCTNSRCMAEEVGACVSFFIASRLGDALALAAVDAPVWGRGAKHDQDGRSIVGLARGQLDVVWVGKRWMAGWAAAAKDNPGHSLNA